MGFKCTPLTAHTPRLSPCSDTPQCSGSAGRFLPAAESHNRERYPQTRHLRPGSITGGGPGDGWPVPSSTASSATGLRARPVARLAGPVAGLKPGSPLAGSALSPPARPPPPEGRRPPRRAAHPSQRLLVHLGFAAKALGDENHRHGAAGKPTSRSRRKACRDSPLSNHWLRSAAPAQEAPPPRALETSDRTEKLSPIGLLASG